MAAWVLAACQSAAATGVSPGVTPVVSIATATRPASRPVVSFATATRPAATATVAPPATANVSPSSAPLDQVGPYLVYVDGRPGAQSLMVVDQTGQSSEAISLPIGYRVESFDQALLPDGRFLVMHAGAARAGTGANDLRLALYDMRAGRLTIDVSVVTPDFPSNLRDLYDRRLSEAADAPSWDEVVAAFEQGIEAFAWSGNGRYLAFAAQIDGPSSDVYLLDVTTGQRRRLTDGAGQVGWLAWSPDGRRVLNASSNAPASSAPLAYFSVDVREDTVTDLGSASQATLDWLDGEHVIIADTLATGRYYFEGAYAVNVVTGERIPIWEGRYAKMWLEWPERRVRVMGCRPDPDGSGAECAWFERDLRTGAEIRTDGLAPSLYRDSVEDNPADRYVDLSDKLGNALWTTFTSVWIRSADGKHRTEFPRNGPINPNLRGFTLAPDNTHAFVVQGDRLVVVDLETARDFVVDDSGWALTPFEYIWTVTIPGRTDNLRLVPTPTPYGAQYGPSPTPPSIIFVEGQAALVVLAADDTYSVAWVNPTTLSWTESDDVCVRQLAELGVGAGRATITSRQEQAIANCPRAQAPETPLPTPAERYGFPSSQVERVDLNADGTRALVTVRTEVLETDHVIGGSDLDPEDPRYRQVWLVDMTSGARELVIGTARALSFGWGYDERYVLVIGGSCYGGNGYPGIYSLELATRQILTLDGDYGLCEGMLGFRHSPTAPLLALPDGQVVDYTGQVLVALCRDVASPRAQAWSEDGRYLYVACRTSRGWDRYDTLRQYEVATGAVVELTSPGRVPVRMVTIDPSPDGRYLAFEWGTNHYTNDEEFGWFVLDTLLVGD